eukprot:TRINITY_DN159_c1_g2_i1.p1 TRINITY_DN159_c1_g2~~TRINITY_DN159_c1_g2_i1.p1  ORF type:complete len:345 (+),score=89.42 TRINITY_DN159_c1_g2_i1:112-1146(+)
MVASTKMYDALGLSPTCTEAEIKKAYKKAALKWHPDRHKDNKEEAEKQFKLVAEAYEVLSDPEKRRIYDQVGEEGMKQGMGGGGGGFPGGFPGGAGGFKFTSSGGGDAHKIFEQFFGSGFNANQAYDDEDPFAQMFSGGMGGGGMRGGMGGMPGGMGGIFNMMGGMGGGGMSMGGMGGMPGQGMRQSKQKGASITFDINLTLEELYTGCTKKRKLTRKRIEGGRLVDSAKIVEVNVLPGWKSGTKVTFAGEGDESPTQAAGDIIFVVKELPHKDFTRDGADLIYKPTISKSNTAPVPIPTPEGKTVRINIPSGTTTSLPDHGMPRRKEGRVIGKGDILIRPVWK